MLKHKKLSSLIIFALVIAAALSACGPQATATDALTPGPSTLTDVAPAATSTPTQGVPTVLLVVTPDADPAWVASLQTTLEALAAESSLAVTVVDTLSPEQLTENIKIVVGVGTGVDLAALAPAAPAVHFVAVGQPNAVPSANLSVIGNALVEEERQTFMGGYLAALVTDDFKVTGLIPSDIALTNEAQNAFVTGARFYCGLCNPKYPPYNAFPQVLTLPTGSDTASLQSVVDTIANLGTEVIYVHPALVTPELLNIIEGFGMEVVSGARPDMPRNNWVGTVALDPAPALTAVWADIMAGNPGQQRPGSIVLLDQEAGLISAGRMRLFDEMQADLEADLVLPETQD